MGATSGRSQHVEGELRPYTIAFMSGEELCRGVRYLPRQANLSGVDGKAPCIILAHGFGCTVESGLHDYARTFAEAGFHALIFDYRHFGASEGDPRQLLSIRRQLQDWQAAIGFARSHPDIDPERIILWGVSLSGGHVVKAAARDGHVHGVIAQFPMLDGVAAMLHVLRYAGFGQILKLMFAGIADVTARLLSGRRVMIPIVGPPGKLAALSTEDAEAGYSAIVTPEWRNEVCAGIALSIPLYRPGFFLRRIKAPVLVQIADNDTILPPASIQHFLNVAGARTQVEHLSSRHFDAFTGDMFRTAVDSQIRFLLTALGETSHEKESA